MKYVCLHLSSYITQTHKYQLPYMHLFDVKKEWKVFIIEEYIFFWKYKNCFDGKSVNRFRTKKPEHCKYYLPIVVGRKEIYF